MVGYVLSELDSVFLQFGNRLFSEYLNPGHPPATTAQELVVICV